MNKDVTIVLHLQFRMHIMHVKVTARGLTSFENGKRTFSEHRHSNTKMLQFSVTKKT